MLFGAEHPRLTSRRFREDLKLHRALVRGRSHLRRRRHHALIGVRVMGIVSLQNAANLTIPGRKVVVRGLVNLVKEEKEKGKERAKAKARAVEEEKARGPL